MSGVLYMFCVIVSIVIKSHDNKTPEKTHDDTQFVSAPYLSISRVIGAISPCTVGVSTVSSHNTTLGVLGVCLGRLGISWHTSMNYVLIFACVHYYINLVP